MSRAERLRSSVGDPWLLLAFLLPAAAVLFSLMPTEDLAYRIRAGDLAWQAGGSSDRPLHLHDAGGVAEPAVGRTLFLRPPTVWPGGEDWWSLCVDRRAVVGVTYLRVKVVPLPRWQQSC